MGGIWAVYGIGLQGPLGTWKAVEGRTVLQDTAALNQAGVLGEPVEVPDQTSYADEAGLVAEQSATRVGHNSTRRRRRPARRVRRPASSSRRRGPSRPGEYQVTGVFDIGGDRYPMIGNFDLLAFWHEPRYALVEVAPIEQTRDESGRAAPASQIDESQQRQYVYMIRDLGARRQPAFVLMTGVDDHLPDVVLAAPPARRARSHQPQPAGPVPGPTAS